MDRSQEIVAVVGLGYVGLPLAVACGKVRRTIGFDTSIRKVGRAPLPAAVALVARAIWA